MPEVFYLGGAPCGGKTTAAIALRERHGLRAFELDRHLERATHEGMLAGSALLRWASLTSPEETWRRSPVEQSYAQWAVYRAAAPYIRKALEEMGEGAPILAEGAGFLPEVLRDAGVDRGHAVFLAPSPFFQQLHMAERPWAARLLEQAEDPEYAFETWMRRCALLAEAIRGQALELGYPVIGVDENSNERETAERIERFFGWNVSQN
ncbi:MAG: hypothetical protein IJS53_00075 [Clostridia bacterium]|nr:hypothetical protein [Clostridia bacterium]